MKTTFTLSKYKDQYNMNHRHIEAKMFDKMPKRNRTTKELSNHSPKTKIVPKKKKNETQYKNWNIERESR